MKYKRRFKWFRQQSSNPETLEVWEADNKEVYWDTLWYTPSLRKEPFLVLRIDGKFFVGPDECNIPQEANYGPYETLREAIAAAETMIALNGDAGEGTTF